MVPQAATDSKSVAAEDSSFSSSLLPLMFKSFACMLLLSAACSPVCGQTVLAPASNIPVIGAYQFCVVVLAAGGGFQLEYGQSEHDALPNPQLEQDAAKIRKMASLATVLTYLSGRGWEYLSATSITTNSLPTFSTEIRYGWSTNYLLRRRI